MQPSVRHRTLAEEKLIGANLGELDLAGTLLNQGEEGSDRLLLVAQKIQPASANRIGCGICPEGENCPEGKGQAIAEGEGCFWVHRRTITRVE